MRSLTKKDKYHRIIVNHGKLHIIMKQGILNIYITLYFNSTIAGLFCAYGLAKANPYALFYSAAYWTFKRRVIYDR